MKYLTLFIYLGLMLFSHTTRANSTQEQLTFTHIKIPSPIVFNVALPDGYHQNKDKTYIVMFDFHPKANTYLSGMHDWLSHNGEWPWLETIIVTPAQGNRVGMLFDVSAKTTPLLDFFQDELFKTIDNKYRTNGFRIISGFRDNGSIVLSALLNKPNLFNAYIAISPELSNNLAGIMSTAENKLKKLTDKPRYLLFSHSQSIKEQHQLELYQQFLTILKQNAPEQLTYQDLPLDKHYFMSLPLLSVIYGIEDLFDDIHQGLDATSAISRQGVNAIIKHYQYLSTQKYGFEVSPKQSILNLAASYQNQPNRALAVYQQLLMQYPDDAYCHHYLAQFYADNNDFKNAVKYQSEAVKLAQNMATWHKKKMNKLLLEYQSKI